MNFFIWIVVGIVIVILLVLFKFKEIRHKFFLVFLTLILLFLFLSFSTIYKAHKPDLTTFDGIVSAGKIYFSWLGNVFHNVSKVSSYVIHQNWGVDVTNQTTK